MAKRKKKRNYRAEYKRRIARALEKGYSRSVARGHPKTKTVKEGKVKRKVVTEIGLKAAKFLGVRPGGNLEDVLLEDARRVFGPKNVPKRGIEDPDAPSYQLRLEEMAMRDGDFDWTNEANFIEQMRAIGLTERDAYKHWFSP